MTRNELRKAYSEFRRYAPARDICNVGRLSLYKHNDGKSDIRVRGRYVSNTGAWAADGLMYSGKMSKDYRRYALENAQAAGPVPLPR